MSNNTQPQRITIEGSTGYGLMSLTFTPTPVPKQQAFETINNALKDGVRFFNAGEFYGMADVDINLNLRYLKEYFEAYPENRSKMIISVKGAFDADTFGPNNSPEKIKESIENIISFFPDEYIDLFEPSRMDLKHEVEDVVKAIVPFIEAGKVGGISLTEVRGETIERANKIYPISCVELEVSMWSLEPLTNGTNEVCQRLGIPIICYAPLGMGFLTGTIKSTSDIPEGDLRSSLVERFSSDEIIKSNLKVVDIVTEHANNKKVTNAQIALAWIRKHNDFPEKYARLVPIPSSSKPSRNHENNTIVELTDSEFDDINERICKLTFAGVRYNKHVTKYLNV